MTFYDILGPLFRHDIDQISILSQSLNPQSLGNPDATFVIYNYNSYYLEWY
jgi:hypothetical protein